ncbi:MAG TPA: hypothetical protein PK648_17795, partial [Verrucomicrobiales bacterium]|nr:hypothetical protein [Verrucomicrobiales bacterium]
NAKGNDPNTNCEGPTARAVADEPYRSPPSSSVCFLWSAKRKNHEQKRRKRQKREKISSVGP